ncbi:hypothetical protein Vadar_000323 [Vaccinium darrowii]|uniref:Uncharacterized protein n=1 Tax=Vaccinium darrowii TaxID=229202 RepID=A0ACB7Y4E3_9ERIC|nr:hypothetical protein Vadar_000323 [Vaccinium darrowii]
MARQPRHQLTVHRPRGRQAPTISIVFREVLEQFGGDPGINDNGRRRGGDDQRILIGRPTNMIFSAKWNVVLLGMLGLLLALIQIMYQNRRSSPFETHPTMMDISLTALCIYGLAAATATLAKFIASKEVEQQPKNYYRILNILGLGLDILGLISALVSLSCLVFVLTLDGPGRIMFVLGASIFFALVVAWIFLFPRIFRPINSGQGAAGANMV